MKLKKFKGKKKLPKKITVNMELAKGRQNHILLFFQMLSQF